MDSNNWRPTQTDQPPPIDAGDWRTQLPHDSRHRVLIKIMEALERHLPYTGQEGLQELRKIAARFEEKTFSSATSQTDYLRKISLKMLTMESKSQNAPPNGVPSNSASGSRNPSDPAPSQSVQSQIQNPGQSGPPQMVSNQSRQPILAPNVQNNVVSSGLQSLASSLPTVSGLTQNPASNVAQTPNLQNMSAISQSSMGNGINQGVASNMLTNLQRQMQGRQFAQQVGMQQHAQHSQNPQQFIYQQQLQHQMMKQKLQQGNMPQVMHTSMQQQPSSQQQSNLLQAAQLQSSLQPIMQTSSNFQPSMISRMQQSQQSSIQPHSQSVLQQHQQSVLRQRTPGVQHQQQAQIPQQSMVSSQHQQQGLMGHQPNAVNMQHNHLTGHQNTISNMSSQQQQLMAQQSNIINSHQKQLMGTQSGNSGMQANQHSLQVMQQTNVPVPQQSQNGASASLSTGGQQPQAQSQSQSQSQPPLMSQLQSQTAQLHQHLGMQQQQQQPNSLQQQIQSQSPLLQQQNMIDQQKQLFQSQRAAPEAPSTSLDSTAQTGSTSSGDWQEDVCQKITAMKDKYYADLNELHQKFSIKLHQHESLPQQRKTEHLEKLKLMKTMLEKCMLFLQTRKSNVLPAHRDKLLSLEKQIMSLLSSQKPRKPMPPMQQGQILSPQLQSMQQAQQSNSQIPPQQSHDSVISPQLQSMNSQGSMHCLSPIISSQKSSVAQLPPSSNLDSVPSTGPSSVQHLARPSLHQNSVSALQNMNPLQSNSNMLQNQHLRQQQEQQMMQTNQLKQQLHNWQIQQQLLQKQQTLQHQAKQQQQATQMHANHMPHLRQMPDVNELKMRQGLSLRSGGFPPLLSSLGQRFAHQQLKPGTSLPVSSPQMLQVASPQFNQNSSLQLEQQNVSPSVPKVGTPLQSANSPFMPSPSTPIGPSPMPGDTEKPAVSSLSNGSNVGHQQTSAAPSTPQSVAIGTPGISVSPFLESGAQDSTHGDASMVISGKSTIAEQPLERLLKAVKSVSPKALNASISDINSAIDMVDFNAGSAPGNGSRASVGEDLVVMTKCRLQARNFLTQDGTCGTKRKRHCAIPLNVVSSAGSMNDSFKQLTGPETSELESTATSSIKKARIEVHRTLVEEIREINERLIDTYIVISDEDIDPSVAKAAARNEGTIVRCCFSAISLNPSLKSHYSTMQPSPIQPLNMLVPSNYPDCSPTLLDKFPVEVSKEQEDLSMKAKSRFTIALRYLSVPMSLREIASTWDDCARAVMSEYAQQNCGGTFSSKYGSWENCLSAA